MVIVDDNLDHLNGSRELIVLESDFDVVGTASSGSVAISLIKKYNPDIASMEKLFYFKNQTTIMPVAEARGVILMALEKYGVKTYEYTPMEVKQVLTGFGRASKKEVEQMVKIALGRDDLPKLDDTIDSIAIAICHTRNCRDLITK